MIFSAKQIFPGTQYFQISETRLKEYSHAPRLQFSRNYSNLSPQNSKYSSALYVGTSRNLK